jgi:hypothetical protein
MFMYVQATETLGLVKLKARYAPALDSGCSWTANQYPMFVPHIDNHAELA